jgi:hypothetical protein
MKTGFLLDWKNRGMGDGEDDANGIDEEAMAERLDREREDRERADRVARTAAQLAAQEGAVGGVGKNQTCHVGVVAGGMDLYGQEVVRVRPVVRQEVPRWFFYAPLHSQVHGNSSLSTATATATGGADGSSSSSSSCCCKTGAAGAKSCATSSSGGGGGGGGSKSKRSMRRSKRNRTASFFGDDDDDDDPKPVAVEVLIPPGYKPDWAGVFTQEDDDGHAHVLTGRYALYDAAQETVYGSARFGTELDEHADWVRNARTHLDYLTKSAIAKAQLHQKHHHHHHHQSRKRKAKKTGGGGGGVSGPSIKKSKQNPPLTSAGGAAAGGAHQRAGENMQCKTTSSQLHLQVIEAAGVGHIHGRHHGHGHGHGHHGHHGPHLPPPASFADLLNL